MSTLKEGVVFFSTELMMKTFRFLYPSVFRVPLKKIRGQNFQNLFFFCSSFNCNINLVIEIPERFTFFLHTFFFCYLTINIEKKFFFLFLINNIFIFIVALYKLQFVEDFYGCFPQPTFCQFLLAFYLYFIKLFYLFCNRLWDNQLTKTNIAFNQIFFLVF